MILDKLPVRTAGSAISAAAIFIAGCAAHHDAATSNSASAKLSVACTISTLCSLVASVGGSDVELHGLVPVGASPETYEPTPSDVVALSRAQILFENGLGLEAWLQKLMTTAAPRGLVAVTLSDSVQRISGNPHLWMDPIYAAAYVRDIAQTLIANDAAHAPAYRANEAAELRQLDALDKWIRTQINTIPPDRRAMICFHDAWFYFDRRYGIKNVGAIEPYAGQEPSPGYFAHLVALAKQYHVRAVFGEPQFSPKLATALQSSAGIKVFTNLYDDTLGTGNDVSSYEAMMRRDVSVIVTALRS